MANIAGMEPALPATSYHTLVWETHGVGKVPDELSLKVRMDITNKELAARYQRLHAKHPANSTITEELGQVYESQGLYSKQLKLYQDFMVSHPAVPKDQYGNSYGFGGFWEFRDAWVKYTERTHNEQNAYIVAPILAKVLGDKDDDWNQSPETLRWFKRYRHSPVQIAGKKPRATAGGATVVPRSRATKSLRPMSSVRSGVLPKA